jgi:hypothetical protein
MYNPQQGKRDDIAVDNQVEFKAHIGPSVSVIAGVYWTIAPDSAQRLP